MSDDDMILQMSKDIVLTYLKQINTEIKESDGVYSISFPSEYSDLFGTARRITFDHDVAATFACELVAPGSDILKVVLNEVRNEAPVVFSVLIQENELPDNFLHLIKTHRCNLGLLSKQESQKLAIRFYYNVTLKNITSISMLQSVNLDLNSLEILDTMPNLVFQKSTKNYEINSDSIEHAYTKSVEELEKEMKPIVDEYVQRSNGEKQRDVNIINSSYERRIKQIREDIDYKASKIKEFDRRIINAKSNEKSLQYAEDKRKSIGRQEKYEEQQIKKILELEQQLQQDLEIIKKRYRPTIEYSLIASQLFSYNASDCILELNNESTHKEITAKFMPFSKHFSIVCDYCCEEIDTIHLCKNKHSVCQSCSNQCSNCGKDLCQHCISEFTNCYLCRENLCQDCTGKCQFCAETTCNCHTLVCSHCNSKMCFFCSDSCQICNKRFCNNSIGYCSSCNNRSCKEDTKQCSQCGRGFCVRHVVQCPACDKISCTGHLSNCESCGQKYGTTCIVKDVCLTCSRLTDTNANDTDVQNLIRNNPDFIKYKKWEKSINEKFIIFKAKKTLGSKIVVMEKSTGKIIESRKGGLF